LASEDWLLTRIATADKAVKSLDEATSVRALGLRLLEMALQFGAVSIIAGAIPGELSAHPSGPCAETGCWRSHPPPDAEAEPKAPSAILAENRTHLFGRAPETGIMTHWVVECARCRDGWISGGKGLLFPVVETDAGVFGLGFFGPELSSSPEVARTLAFFAHYAFVRFVKIDRLIAAPRLSERLILTLKWAAEGKTDQEIALILNVSGHTVDKYMRQLKQELNAVNRTSAIVLAIRHGLIG
jgi:LuxR family quorum sensing-dependent transcriptional regulator